MKDRSSIQFCAASLCGLLSACSGPLSSLDPAGPHAATAAQLWWGMFAFLTAVFLIVIILWLYAMKRKPGRVSDEKAQRIQNRWILGGGLALPIVSISLILLIGIPAGRSMLPLPPQQGEALRVDVQAAQWQWRVSYPNIDVTLTNELHIPAGQAVDVHLTTADVIHSFWVPRLAGKLDTIPGRTNVLRLEATSPGVYLGQCAEFCGLEHAAMKFAVIAHSPADFEAWLKEKQDND
ncbi:cytochrome c oxidase subunit II [Allohahella sp. A8]|uniref:cytochrome c oxidase subunit II n=1 Tax=Allohahella sp. A8 TaxID=3141461 RepID=UPI003A807BF5